MKRPTPIAWALPIVLYFCLSGLYLFAVPPGESPDEPSHLQCIEQVTAYSRIPIIDPKPQGNVWWARERIISGLVCAHMPLYYFLAGYTQQIVQAVSGVPAHYEFPPNDPAWSFGASRSMFLHPAGNTWLKIDEPASLTVLRIESILLGLMSVLGAGLIARRIAPDSPHAPIAAMSLMAGWPQFVFMSRAINNDTLAVALSIGSLAVLLDAGKPRRFILASTLAALAILSKLTMILTIAVIAVTFALEFRASHERSAYLRAGLLSALVFGLLGALIWFEPTLHAHLDWSRATLAGRHPDAGTPGYWLNVLHTTIQSGWARFGWMNVATPDVLAYAWWTLLVIGSAAGIVHSARSQDRPTRLALAVCGVWLAAVLGAYLWINLNRFQPQFRYAFSAAPVLAAFAGSGLVALLDRRARLRPVALLAVGAALALINLWLVAAIVVPAYN